MGRKGKKFRRNTKVKQAERQVNQAMQLVQAAALKKAEAEEAAQVSYKAYKLLSGLQQYEEFNEFLDENYLVVNRDGTEEPVVLRKSEVDPEALEKLDSGETIDIDDILLGRGLKTETSGYAQSEPVETGEPEVYVPAE